MEAKSPFYNLMQMALVVRDLVKIVKGLEKFGVRLFENPPPVNRIPIFRGKQNDAKLRGLITRLGNVEFEVNQSVEGETSQ